MPRFPANGGGRADWEIGEPGASGPAGRSKQRPYEDTTTAGRPEGRRYKNGGGGPRRGLIGADWLARRHGRGARPGVAVRQGQK